MPDPIWLWVIAGAVIIGVLAVVIGVLWALGDPTPPPAPPPVVVPPTLPRRRAYWGRGGPPRPGDSVLVWIGSRRKGSLIHNPGSDGNTKCCWLPMVDHAGRQVGEMLFAGQIADQIPNLHWCPEFLPDAPLRSDPGDQGERSTPR